MSLGIYIHIPFCKAKCLYCDFNSYAGIENKIVPYLEALCKEIEQNKQEKKVNSLYIGGGTPTAIGAEKLEMVLTKVKQNYALCEDCEITVECNPGTIDKNGLLRLRKAGFNRISIGVQAGCDEMLKRLGRIHTFADSVRCVFDAKVAGFDNISLDLMYGLPGQTLEMWQETLQKVVDLKIEHLSCYGLKVEEGTPLAAQNPVLPSDDEVAAFYDMCVNFLGKNGFHRYETSNFAISKERESRHNKKYWQCEDFLGFGAGAYACVGPNRYSNFLDIDEYCTAIKKDGSAVNEEIPLTLQDQMSEFCFLGLRMDEGISIKDFYNRFGVDIHEIFGEVIEKNLRRGTLLRLGDFLKIDPNFSFVCNGILADFV